MQPLKTKSDYFSINYMRCNCKIGINPNSKRFLQFYENIEYIDETIPRILYNDIINPPDKHTTTVVEQNTCISNIESFLVTIMAYLPISHVSIPICVSHVWYNVISTYTEYTHIRDFIPKQVR